MKTTYLILLVLLFGFYSLPKAQTSYGNAIQGNAGNGGGDTNSYFGYQTGLNSTGSQNTFTGYQSGLNTTGVNNVANGYRALFSNTTGSYNTATGYAALWENTTGEHNTAYGNEALRFNETGGFNTAVGSRVLQNNTTGSWNTAVGHSALYFNTTGYANIANGHFALRNNTTGSYNTANGNHALYDNTTGGYNTAIGRHALRNNTTGSYNTANGGYALYDNTTGSSNTALGYSAGPNTNNGGLNNTTSLGRDATPTASNQVRLGNSAVTSIGGYEPWSNLSDARFKKAIKEDIPGLDFITQLRPVSYVLDRIKLRAFLGKEPAAAVPSTSGTEHSARRGIGFIAQEVQQLLRENGYTPVGIESPQNEGDHYRIRYAEFVVPLVKGMQEQQQLIKSLQLLVEQQQQQLEALKNKIYGQEKQLKAPETHLKEHTSLPEGFALAQNTPNPFDQRTIISVQLPETVKEAGIVIYNLQGRALQKYPFSGRGKTSVEIKDGVLPEGMYLYALLADGQLIATKRMILTR